MSTEQDNRTWRERDEDRIAESLRERFGDSPKITRARFEKLSQAERSIYFRKLKGELID